MSNVKRAKSQCHCINIRRAANSISKLYDSYLNEVKLSANQYALLVSLGRLDKPSVTDLANYVGLERSTLVRTLRPLIERNLVADISSEGQRNRILQLTQEGERLVKEGRTPWLEAQRDLEDRLGADNVRLIEDIISSLDN